METYNKAQEYSVNTMENIYKKYSYLFKDKQSLLNSVPIGWLAELERALEAFSKTGLQLKIEKFEFEGKGGLGIKVVNPYPVESEENIIKFAKYMREECSAHYILDALLNNIHKLCVLCGESTGEFGLCKACLDDRDNNCNAFKLKG